jgi:hypothetical protein
MVNYKLIKCGIGRAESGVVRLNDDGTLTSFICDPANTDYVAYLAWVAEGNAPLPPDDQTGQNTPIQE